MILLKRLNKLFCTNELLKKIKGLGSEGRSLRLRLVILFILFLIIFLTAIYTILLATGVFHTGVVKTNALIENELKHISEHIYEDFGNISMKGVSLAKAINNSIEHELMLRNIEIHDIKKHPEVLKEILDKECEKLITALFSTKSSGVFLILDATVNPDLPYADTSRAGLYIRNMEPNIVDIESSYLLMLKGSTTIANNYQIAVHPQWDLEFDTQTSPYYSNTIDTAINNSSLPLNRLYYWSSNTVLPDTTDTSVLCAIPLIASDKTVYGVCGFEINSLLFKLSYSPNETISNKIFSLLAQMENNTIDCSTAYTASSYSAVLKKQLIDTSLTFKENNRILNKYECPTNSFVGLHNKIPLYPNDSPYKDQVWIISVMVPEENYESTLDNIDKNIVLLLSALLIMGIIAAFFISKFYLKPIRETISQIKSKKLSEIEKTNIPEIDDFIEFLTRQDKKQKQNQNAIQSNFLNVYNSNMFTSFLKNIDTLSPAERSVFDLYIEGYTAREIAEKLYLSINTIKTHNKRIYEKMNVSSRNELMVYIKMMKELEAK
ncbi:MAG: LuxR family transcriptional regulator [Clostridiaceae bacterium]|nr:LuxR family transcriptional regulator [Clostridiaceae bacterium]